MKKAEIIEVLSKFKWNSFPITIWGYKDERTDANAPHPWVEELADLLASLDRGGDEQIKRFLYDKFLPLCENTKFKQDREFANVNAEGYADEVIEWMRGKQPQPTTLSEGAKVVISNTDLEGTFNGCSSGVDFTGETVMYLEEFKLVISALVTQPTVLSKERIDEIWEKHFLEGYGLLEFNFMTKPEFKAALSELNQPESDGKEGV